MTVLSDSRLAALMVAAGFPRNQRVIAEGIATVHAESGGDPQSKVPGNEHMGLWAESSAFGSEADRLDPLKSTIAARKEWEKDGSFYPAWGRWEAEQSGRNAALDFRKYLSAAASALRGGVRWVTGEANAPKGHEAPRVSGGSSGAMKFLLTAALVLGGIALVGLGMMRTVGSAPRRAAA